MSETAPQVNPERQPAIAEAPAVERHHDKVEDGRAEQAAKAEHLEQAHAALAAAETTAKQPVVPQLPAEDRPTFIDNVAKTLRMQKNLQHVQSKLKPGDKALSKVIHQPLVRAVSDGTAKTVSRPSGLLGGGIMAFAGSVLYLFLAHHIGFSYNYTLFLGFFVSGFLIGLLAELALHGLRRQKA